MRSAMYLMGQACSMLLPLSDVPGQAGNSPCGTLGNHPPSRCILNASVGRYISMATMEERSAHQQDVASAEMSHVRLRSETPVLSWSSKVGKQHA